MKTLTLFFAAIYSTVHIHGQNSLTDNKVVIVSCKTGDLYIDGALVGKLEADDAKQQVLSIGEHYLQLKTGSEKLNLTVKIDQNTKDIIRIGCEVSISQMGSLTPVSTPAKEVLLFDKQLNLGGALSNEVQQNIVALDEGDNILLTCAVLNKKGSANISIKEYLSGTEIYRKESFNSIEQQQITVPSKGIYIFNVTTGALFGKDIKLSVSRIPSVHSDPNFKTTVKRYYDTLQAEVLNTSEMVHSTGNLTNTNKTIVKITLPQNTSYWVYWIGVGQEAKEKMKVLVIKLSSVAATASANPLISFGMKLIPELPMLNGKSSITYRFMDSQNAALFQSNHPCSPYNFSYADNVITTYAVMNTAPKDLVLALANTSPLVGQEVNIRVVAFSIRQKLGFE